MSAGLKMEIILSYLRDCCFDETKKIVVLMKLKYCYDDETKKILNKLFVLMFLFIIL